MQDETIDKHIKEYKEKEKEKELALLSSDPWVKRLNGRIDQKNSELENIAKDIEDKKAETDKLIERLNNKSEGDIDRFNKLREDLKKDLKKAKLKRELDLLNAGSEGAKEQVVIDYKKNEKRIYLRLLDALYSHEEKIFQARLDSAREDAKVKNFDFYVDQKK